MGEEKTEVTQGGTTPEACNTETIPALPATLTPQTARTSNDNKFAIPVTNASRN